MAIKIEYDGISINLTKEQVAHVVKEASKKTKTIEDIDDYFDACEILSEEPKATPSIFEILNTMARAANFIDNGNKVWKPNFKDTNVAKWTPYHKMTEKGLVFVLSYCDYGGASGLVGFYMKESTSDYMGKKLIKLFEKLFDSY